ncbi:MAG: hypothetical protein K9G33_11430 [Sneathiella sp.]|nr:hypothetical protein [Sneathiella sp.]
MQHETISKQTGEELYCLVRANLISNGTSFAEWCRNNAISRQYAAKVLISGSKGRKAIALKNKILAATVLRESK